MYVLEFSSGFIVKFRRIFLRITRRLPNGRTRRLEQSVCKGICCLLLDIHPSIYLFFSSVCTIFIAKVYLYIDFFSNMVDKIYTEFQSCITTQLHSYVPWITLMWNNCIRFYQTKFEISLRFVHNYNTRLIDIVELIWF